MTLENNTFNFKAVVDAMPDGILVANKEGRFIMWNQTAFKLFRNELINSLQPNWVRDWGVYQLDKVTPYVTDDLPLSRALKGYTTSGQKLYLKNSSQEEIYIKVYAYPLTENGEVTSAVVIVEDITSEQLLYESIINKINELEDHIQKLLDVTE